MKNRLASFGVRHSGVGLRCCAAVLFQNASSQKTGTPIVEILCDRGNGVKYIQVGQLNLVSRETAPLRCRELFYWADYSVARAIGVGRVDLVIVGGLRLEVFNAHAENRVAMGLI